MKEESVCFGQHANLNGTLTFPDQEPLGVAFILLNAGIIHRVGPHRFNVKLARNLSEGGYVCLRFDLAGLGDSRHSQAPRANFQLQAQSDIGEAINCLESSSGIRRVCIVGICSGAQNGLAAAMLDERIVGLYMIDGYAYETSSTHWRRRLLQFRSRPYDTLRLWIVRALSAFRRESSSSRAVEQVDFGNATPPKQAFVSMLNALTSRGTKIGACFTGSWIWRYSYAGQWRDAFGQEDFVDAVEVTFNPRLDHTLSTLAAQQTAMGIVRDWATKHFAQT